MKVLDVCRAIEEWAPTSLAYEWDRIGLSVGDPEWDVKHILVALTVTSEVFAQARQLGADMIVSHHPLIHDPLTALRLDDPHASLCLRLAEARIACYAAHTNLDVAVSGVNHVLAQKLGLVNVSTLFSVPQAAQVKLVTFVPETHLAQVRDAVCAAGAGVIGNYTHCSYSVAGFGTFKPNDAAGPFSGSKNVVNEEPERRFEVLAPKAYLADVLKALKEAHPYEEVAYDVVSLENRDSRLGMGVRGLLDAPATLDDFAHRVREALGVSHVRVVGDPNQLVSKIAAIGGSGGGEIPSIPTDVDVLVTGDVKYHQALEAQERGLAIVDAGHTGTEACIVPALGAYLERRFADLHVSHFDEPEVFRVIGNNA